MFVGNIFGLKKAIKSSELIIELVRKYKQHC